MKLALVAVFVPSTVVVDSVSKIRILLDLANQTACSDGVDGARGDKIALPCLNLVEIEQIRESITFYGVLELRG